MSSLLVWFVILILFLSGVSRNSGGLVAFSVVAAVAWGLVLLNRRSSKPPMPAMAPRPRPTSRLPAGDDDTNSMKYDAFSCKSCGAQNPAGVAISPVCDFCGAAAPAPKAPAIPTQTVAAPREVPVDDGIGVSSFGQVCSNCRTYVSVPKKEMPGSFGVEVLLWFFYIVPGILYSMWRRNEDNWKPVCANCDSKNFVPVSSPEGRRLFEAKYGRRPRFD